MSLAARKIRLVMQLRQSGVVDTNVLSAIERVPREAFVPAAFQDRAYENITLPIGQGQTLSQPQVVAKMTQALKADRRMKVLEIGTGSGYQTAVLSKLCRRVYSIERYRELLQTAEQRLAHLRVHNVTMRVGDGWQGWREQAPFQRIIATAAHGREDEPPPALVEQLAVGGILVIPMGDEKRSQKVMRFRRTEDGLEREALWPVRFVPLTPDAAAEGPDPGRRRA